MAVRPRAHVTRLCKGKYFTVSLMYDYVRQANFTTKLRFRTIVFAFTLFLLGCSFQLSLTHSPTYARTHWRAHSFTHPLTHSLTHSLTHALTHSRTLPTSLSRLEHKPSINRLHSTLSLVLAYASAHVRPSSSSFFITVLLRVFCGRRSSSQLESIWWQLWVSCHWAFVGYDQAIAASGFELYLLRNSCLQNRLGS